MLRTGKAVMHPRRDIDRPDPCTVYLTSGTVMDAVLGPLHVRSRLHAVSLPTYSVPYALPTGVSYTPSTPSAIAEGTREREVGIPSLARIAATSVVRDLASTSTERIACQVYMLRRESRLYLHFSPRGICSSERRRMYVWSFFSISNIYQSSPLKQIFPQTLCEVLPPRC